MNKDKNKWIEHVLYCKALLDSIHYGASSPFIPIYAIELGASPIEIGILYSLSNLSLNFFQVIWGYLSDRLIKYVMFIILGGFFLIHNDGSIVVREKHYGLYWTSNVSLNDCVYEHTYIRSIFLEADKRR